MNKDYIFALIQAIERTLEDIKEELDVGDTVDDTPVLPEQWYIRISDESHARAVLPFLFENGYDLRDGRDSLQEMMDGIVGVHDYFLENCDKKVHWLECEVDLYDDSIDITEEVNKAIGWKG